MNSNIKKILTALLAVAIVVTTVFPGSRSVYAEEKPTAEMLTTEEEKQASALKETLNDEGQLDKQGQTNPEETGKQNIVDQKRVERNGFSAGKTRGIGQNDGNRDPRCTSNATSFSRKSARKFDRKSGTGNCSARWK